MIPIHGDYYNFYPSSLKQSLLLFEAPRFVAVFFKDIFGIIGMKAVIVFLIIVNGIKITLTILLIKTIGKIKLFWPTVILYLILIFANPWFYIKYSYDLSDSLAYFFAILAMFIWSKVRKSTGNKYMLVLTIVLFLSLFSKETYFIGLFVFWVFQYFFPPDKNKKKNILFIMAISIALFGLSLLHGHYVDSPFLDFDNVNKLHPYYVNFNLKSIFTTYLFYLKEWGNLGVAGLLFVAFFISIFSKKYLKEIILFLIIGFSTYIPYSLLTNHKLAYYYWLSVPLVYGVILFITPETLSVFLAKIRNKKIVYIISLIFWITVVFFGGFSLKKFNDSYKTPEVNWNLVQENINKNMLDNLPYIKNNVDPSDNVLLIGLNFPFHPFSSSNYIDSYFGTSKNIAWTVVAYGNIEENRHNGSITFLGIKKIDLSAYNKTFVFDNNGKLLKKLEKGENKDLSIIN